jgi:hypothetical protein
MITLREDVICPIACGSCCIDCKDLTKDGCAIKDRTKRPIACNAYMCGEGSMKFNDIE